MSNHVLGEELEDYFLTECDSSKSSNIISFSQFILQCNEMPDTLHRIVFLLITSRLF